MPIILEHLAGVGEQDSDRSASTGITKFSTGSVTWPAANGKTFTLGVAGSANLPQLKLSTADAAVNYGFATDLATFAGDVGTDHADRLMRIGNPNGNGGGNYVAQNRSNFQIGMEYEYAVGTPRTITGITNASPMVVTVAATAGMTSGDHVYISGVVGATGANGHWKAKNLTATTFELWNPLDAGDTASAAGGVWTSGGVVIDRLTEEFYLAWSKPGSNNQDRPIGCTWNNAGTYLSTVSIVPTAGLTLTSGAAATWSTAAGLLKVDGFTGLSLQKNTVAYLDLGNIAAATISVGQNIDLTAVGGTSKLDFSLSSGAWLMPTGAGSWSADNGKSFTLSGGNQALLDIVSANGFKVRATTTDGWQLSQLSAKSWKWEFLGPPVDTGTFQFGGTNLVNLTVVGTIANTAGSGGGVSLLGTGAVTIGATNSSGAFTLDAGAQTVNAWTSASARTTNVCTGNAIQTINIGTHATPVNVIKVGGTSSQLGLYSTTPAVQGAVGATLTNNVTAGGTTNQVDDFTDLTLYANSAAAIRNNIYQLALKLATVEAKLKLLGAVKT